MRQGLLPTRVRSSVASLFALATIFMATAAAAQPVVTTDKGPVKGLYQGRVAQFLGIPFAAPPVGSLRWMPPTEAAPWTTTRDATAFGPACAQSTTLGVFAGPTNENEDCLYLNIYAPRSARAGRDKLPVLVWVHGGGMVNGASHDHDGSLLAEKGGLVVVTINYRLNLMGFLAHPALDAEGHPFGNYGLLDQQAALRWVRNNIARFGGDPGNVTLAGQSAGATSLGLHMISPMAKGLFHKGILQSGQSYWTPMPLAAARARGIAFAEAAGCGSGTDAATAACLRNVPASAIEKLANPAPGAPAFTVVSILDGQILTRNAADAFTSGDFHHVPIMNGSVQDEGNFFLAIEQYESGKPITEANIAAFTGAMRGDAGPKVLQAYPAEQYRTPQLRLSAIRTDPFACRVRRANSFLAGKVPLYVYEFQDRTFPGYFPDMPGFATLADHTAELAYLFPGYHGGNKGVRRPLNAAQLKLSDTMVRAWSNFARTGNPNGQGAKPWPAYVKDPDAQTFRAFGLGGPATFSDRDFATRHKCAFWDAMG